MGQNGAEVHFTGRNPGNFEHSPILTPEERIPSQNLGLPMFIIKLKNSSRDHKY